MGAGTAGGHARRTDMNEALAVGRWTQHRVIFPPGRGPAIMLTSRMRTLWLWEGVACSDPRRPYVAELEREPASAGPKAFPVLLHGLFSLVLSWFYFPHPDKFYLLTL